MRVFFRYFNCEVFYEEDETIGLLKGLSAVPKNQRISFFEAAVRSRRRDRMDWRGTDIEAVFLHVDEQKLMRLQVHEGGKTVVAKRYRLLEAVLNMWDCSK